MKLAYACVLVGMVALPSASAQQKPEFKGIKPAANYVNQKQNCRKLGPGWRIASIHNNEENTAAFAACKALGNVPCYIGAYSDGNGDWRWEDGTPWWRAANTDGIQGRGETKIALNVNDNRWHDWAQGQAGLFVVCRKEATSRPTTAPTTSRPTGNPVTSRPTIAPTKVPTYWFNHVDFGDNFTNLVNRVNGLALEAANAKAGDIITGKDVSTLKSQMSTVMDKLDAIIATQNRIDARLNQTRDSIQAAVTSFSDIAGGFSDIYDPEGCTENCAGFIESSGLDLAVKAPAGAVKMFSVQCGEMDPCKMQTELNGIAAAMTELKNNA